MRPQKETQQPHIEYHVVRLSTPTLWGSWAAPSSVTPYLHRSAPAIPTLSTPQGAPLCLRRTAGL